MEIPVAWEGTPFSRKQAYSIVDSDHAVNLWSGSVRSGKTFASIVRWFMYLANPPEGGELVMVGRTKQSLARNVIQPMKDENLFGDLAHQVKYTRGADTATIMGRTVHILGANDTEAESKIRGLTGAGAYVDEVTILHPNFFRQLTLRMSVKGAQIFATTNPDSQHHWLKAEYIDKVDMMNQEARDDGLGGSWRLFEFQLDDNPGLSEDYKRDIKAAYSGLWYQRFILGEWVSAEGAVYDMWDAGKHVIDWNDLPPMQEWFGIGVDHGTTNPTSAILMGLGEDGVLYFVDEWRYAPRSDEQRLTDADMAGRLRKWMKEPHHPIESENPGGERMPVILDPAAASFKVQLKSEDTRVVAANNEVLYGIRTLSTLLGNQQIKVTDRCKGFISEVTGYSWDQKATDKGEDAVIKKADHSLDAARYIVATTERRWIRRIAAPVTTNN